MRLEDCYKLLEIDPRASDEEVKRAHRDMAKVWHPDRFQQDPAMFRRAQEKLKAINEAYEMIRSARQGTGRWRTAWSDDDPSSGEADGWRVRTGGREMRVSGLEEIFTLASRGYLSDDAEIYDPGSGRWSRVAEMPELQEALEQRRLKRYRGWALFCAGLGLLILVRRPTPAGLIIGLVLFGIAFFLLAVRMRQKT